MSDIVERLRNVAAAYPEEFFPPFTQEELDEHSVIISRASGRMGRFLSKHMQGAAAEIERLRKLFLIDGEQHAAHIKALTEAHVARICKYVEVLDAERAKLREAVEVMRDCIALLDGDIGGSAQQTGVLAEARAFLAKLEGRSGE